MIKIVQVYYHKGIILNLLMYINSFSIKEVEGLNFAKFSGDNNLIHLSNIVGYNSIYGNKIAHGVLVILKFLKITKANNFSSLKVHFKNAFKYNSQIKIIRTKNQKNYKSYKLKVGNEVCAYVELSMLNYNNVVNRLKKITYKKNYLVSSNVRKKFKHSFISEEIIIALSYLSKYVGTVYPGKNSLITEINLFNNNSNLSNNICIHSNLMDKRVSIIDNRLTYKNYYLEFKTLIRPELKVKLHMPSKKVLRSINSIEKNILIIGASSGIGNDLLKLFLYNKKIKIIGTYYKNRIHDKRKNLIIKKLNIENNFIILLNIIKKYHPLNIYYFPTPRIKNRYVENKIVNLYKKYYIYWPLKIIKFANKYKSNFFYPSTIFVEKETLYPYSVSKLQAEKKILKLKKLKIKVKIARIPEINTKQNLLLANYKLPNFRNIISKSKKIHNAVFFKN